MSETCRVRRGEGYKACDDEARRRRGGPGAGTQKPYREDGALPQ